MDITPTSLLPLISAILVFGLGLFVFSKNPKSKLNIVFSLITVTVTIWLFGTFMMFNSQTDKQAIFWDRFIYMGVVFVPALMYHFSIIFSNRRGQKKLLILSYIFSCIFLILSRTEYFVSDLFKYDWGVHTQAKFFHHVFLLNFFYFLSLTLRNFYQYYRDKSLGGLEKTRAKYVFFAFFVLIIIGSTAYAPAYQISIYPFSFVSGLIFTVILAYAILKYRLMDIRFVLGRGAVYGFSLITIILLAFLLIFLRDQFLDTVPLNITGPLILIIGILFFQPVFKFFEKLASKYFYYTFYSYQTVLTNLGKKSTQFLDLDKLSSLIISTLIDTMKLERTIIILKEPYGGKYKIQKNVGFREENGISLIKDNFLTNWIKKNQKPLICEELSFIIRDTTDKEEKEKLEKLRENMKRAEASLFLPLFIEKKIIGIIVLGNKISGDPYSEQDIDLLTNLSDQASISLQNAMLYHKVKGFGEKLEKEVEKRTKELKEAYEKLKKLDRAKSEFVSIASHQLRTPLTVIKGYISMMLEKDYGNPPEVMKPPLKNIYTSNERLIKLVNDLLNVSRIEAGRIEIKKESFSLEEIVKSIIEELKGLTEKKGIYLKLEKPRKSLPNISADKDKIRQAIVNIIDNAIHYTVKEGIVVKIEEYGNKLRISIKDTGEGMTKTELSCLFESFSRGKAGTKLWTEGAGLGLYVTKKFIELNKGKIWAESTGKNKGSTFYIELPIK